MNPRIIALRGRGSIGKSTTLVLLSELIQPLGWTPVSQHRHGNGIDIIDVFVNDQGDRLGIASAGDHYDEVAPAIRKLISEGCTTIVCACRTKDMPNAQGVVRGTNTALREFSNNITYINKTVEDPEDKPACDQANQNDVNQLVNLI